MRNELFMELADLALGCDNFVIDLLALAKAWIDNKDITRGEFLKLNKPTVSFYKGPYSIDPLADVIANTQQMLTMFEKLSPTMMRNLYRQLVMAATSNDNADRDTIFNEIDRSLSGVIEDNATQRALAMAAVAQAAAAPDNTSVRLTLRRIMVSLDRLLCRVHNVYSFCRSVLFSRVGCGSHALRRKWINDLFGRYLFCSGVQTGKQGFR
jgi:hypothetical protein